MILKKKLNKLSATGYNDFHLFTFLPQFSEKKTYIFSPTRHSDVPLGPEVLL